jgi:hypothetical protein
MKRHIVYALAGASLALGPLASSAQEGPEQDCASLGEVALVARALAEEKVDKPRAHSILRRIYEIPDEQARRLARVVVESAYKDTSSAGEFALKFEAVCRTNQGDVASLLGPARRAAAGAKTM